MSWEGDNKVLMIMWDKVIKLKFLPESSSINLVTMFNEGICLYVSRDGEVIKEMDLMTNEGSSRALKKCYKFAEIKGLLKKK